MIGIGTTERQRSLIDAQARAWQLKLQQGELQSEEMEEFGQWMCVPAHSAAYADCEWSSVCIDALDKQDDSEWNQWKQDALERARTGGPKVEPLANWSDLVFSPNANYAKNARPRILKPLIALAACFALVAFGFSWQRATNTNVLHYQAVDSTREVLLPDGTRLTLDAGTSVDYTRVGNTRRLSLPASCDMR